MRGAGRRNLRTEFVSLWREYGGGNMVAGGSGIAHLHMQELVNYQSMSQAGADTGKTPQAAGSSQGARDGGRGGEMAGAGARYAVVYDASALMTALPLAPGECPAVPI